MGLLDPTNTLAHFIPQDFLLLILPGLPNRHGHLVSSCCLGFSNSIALVAEVLNEVKHRTSNKF